MSDQMANGPAPRHQRVPLLEYRIYFAAIFVAALPFTFVATLADRAGMPVSPTQAKKLEDKFGLTPLARLRLGISFEEGVGLSVRNQQLLEAFHTQAK